MAEHNNITIGISESKCCGCGSCVNICPANALRMGESKCGFAVPTIDQEKCIGCERCISACPYHHLEAESTAIEVYAAVNTSDNILVNSSSGGVFAELAKATLSEGGFVFGCTLDDGFKAKHISVENEEELHSIMRSKYIQSDLGDSFKKVKNAIKSGQKVLFSGTPCMVAGLKSFLGKESNNALLVTVDVVCHGVSSQSLFNDYLTNLNKQLGTPVTKYTFRAKDKASNGMQWKVAYETSKKKYTRNWPEDSYNFYYMMGYTHRESCYECPFASPHRYSDITLCDYWNWNDFGLPFNIEDSVSGVVINSQKGVSLFKKVKHQFRIAQSDFKSLSKHNGGLVHHGERPKDRDKIVNIWKNEGYESLDAYFKKNNKCQILKYRIMRMLPYKFICLVHKIL